MKRNIVLLKIPVGFKLKAQAVSDEPEGQPSHEETLAALDGDDQEQRRKRVRCNVVESDSDDDAYSKPIPYRGRVSEREQEGGLAANLVSLNGGYGGIERESSQGGDGMSSYEVQQCQNFKIPYHSSGSGRIGRGAIQSVDFASSDYPEGDDETYDYDTHYSRLLHSATTAPQATSHTLSVGSSGSGDSFEGGSDEDHDYNRPDEQILDYGGVDTHGDFKDRTSRLYKRQDYEEYNESDSHDDFARNSPQHVASKEPEFQIDRNAPPVPFDPTNCACIQMEVNGIVGHFMVPVSDLHRQSRKQAVLPNPGREGLRRAVLDALKQSVGLDVEDIGGMDGQQDDDDEG